VAALAAFNLREIWLADAFIQFRSDRSDHFLLSHVPIEAAQVSLHRAQVANFLREGHIAICNKCIANCDLDQARISTRGWSEYPGRPSATSALRELQHERGARERAELETAAKMYLTANKEAKPFDPASQGSNFQLTM